MNTYPRAIDVTCPKCLARPGRTCSRLDGSPMVRSHRERHQHANRVYHKAQKKPAKQSHPHPFVAPTPTTPASSDGWPPVAPIVLGALPPRQAGPNRAEE